MKTIPMPVSMVRWIKDHLRDEISDHKTPENIAAMAVKLMGAIEDWEAATDAKITTCDAKITTLGVSHNDLREACISYRHDFGLLTYDEQTKVRDEVLRLMDNKPATAGEGAG